MTGIYKITNKVNDHAYIGQSVNIGRRWSAHRGKPFEVGCDEYETPLYRAIRKYGLDNFSFEVLEECKVDQLNAREKYWIGYYDTFFSGYNQGIGGNTKRTFADKEKIIGIIHDLETTNLLHREIAEKYSISVEMVQGINTGRYWKYDREYPIQNRYRRPASKKLINPRKISSEPSVCVDCGVQISNGATRCLPCANLASRKVERPTRDQLKSEIKNNSFSSLGRKYKVTDNAIRKWCISYSLPSKTKEIKQYTEEEWERL